jgi:hypothetical protein
MQAPPGAPAERRDVFDILELLESVPGVFSDVLLPQLEPRHKAALALTCTVLRDAVQHSARTLTLRAGGCCLSRAHLLGQHLPNIRSMYVRPGNLHEAMFVLPLLFMQVGWHARGAARVACHAWGATCIVVDVLVVCSSHRSREQLDGLGTSCCSCQHPPLQPQLQL